MTSTRVAYKTLVRALRGAHKRGLLFVGSEGTPWTWSRRRSLFWRDEWDDEVWEYVSVTFDPKGKVCVIRDGSIYFYSSEQDAELDDSANGGRQYYRLRLTAVEPVDFNSIMPQ